MGDKARGQTLYEEHCMICHGSEGIEVKFGGDAAYPLDVAKFTLASLTNKIDTDMPPALGGTLPSDCEGQCAADVAAYVSTWAVEQDLSCDPERPVSYSPRRLRLLTANEYQNTLEDLLGVTEDYRDDVVSDNRKGKFPDNSVANVDEGRANKFWNNAEKIAKWAIENGKPFACDADSDCSSPFMEFVPKMYRRPLTNAEVAVFENIFGSYSGPEALEIALTAALNSPQFLYRSEMGRKVSDVLSGEGIEPRYVPVEPLTVIQPEDFFQGDVTDGFAEIPLYNGAGKTLPYTFTGNDIIKMQVRGQMADGAWPTLMLSIDNKETAMELIDFSSTRTITMRIEGITGQKYVRIENKNQASHSQTRNIYLGAMTFGGAQLEVPSKGDEDKLMQADADAYVLTPYELATYLSYTLTGSAPDDLLLAAAAEGGLDYPEQIRAQVDRLLDTPRGRKQMGVFAGYWFDTDRVTTSDVNRDTAIFPNYTPEVRESMAEEVRQLFSTIFFDSTGKYPFESLYKGDFTVVNSVLADYYGIDAPSTSPTDWKLVDGLDQRGGILTTGAFMTVNAHLDKTAPIIRAVRVREQMLCQHVDPPPLLVEDRQHLLEKAEAEYKNGTLTSRGYYEIITDSPACAGCHQYQINPMFGTEDFDQVGLWRDTQKGSTGMTLPIDPSGILYGPDNVTDTATAISFNGAKGLSKVLGDLPGTHECLVEKSFRYAIGMPIENKAVDTNFEPFLTDEQKLDFACAGDKAMAAYEASNHSPRAVMTELVMQDFVRFRKAK